jgi:hypothetical protein
VDPRSVEVLVGRLAAVDLRLGVLDVAEELPRIFRDLVDALGVTEAQRRFDEALAQVLAGGSTA